MFKNFLIALILGSGASAQGGSYGNNSSSDLSDSDEIVIDFDNLELRVYQGDITKANVDVIVNSTNPQFDLTRGNIQATTLCTYRIQIIVF